MLCMLSGPLGFVDEGFFVAGNVELPHDIASSEAESYLAADY